MVAVEKKKREQNGAGAVTTGAKNRNRSSRKLVHSIELCPGMPLNSPGVADPFFSPVLIELNFVRE